MPSSNLRLPDELSLTGKFVSLEPLQASHAKALVEAAADGELWHLTVSTVPNESTVAEYIRTALTAKEAGTEFPFVVRHLQSDRIVGSTRYYAISERHRNISIGYTWYAQSMQRTVVNSECKLLLLPYAFEKLNCIAVQWHTDSLNLVSQKAIERLGAIKGWSHSQRSYHARWSYS